MATDNVKTYLIELEDKVSAELKKTAKQADALEAELKDLREEQKRGAKADQRRAAAMGALSTGFAATAAAAAAVGAAFAGMGAHAIGTSANLEGFETRLGVLLGGLDKGKARVRELFELSASTPFSIQGLVEADATLEAFGANADRVRGGVMDLAGATGMDLVQASNAVGKALAGGAGAADVLREKGVLAMVEVTAGMSTAEMTTDQFREALIDTLETSDKIAGGTALMAQTFDGLMSTLKDQFTIFSKTVGDADLFSTAKATLSTVLDLINENKAAVASLAQWVGETLTGAILSAVDGVFKLAFLVQRVREGWATVGQVVTAVQIIINEMHRAALNLAVALGVMTEAQAASGIAEQTADIAELNAEFAKSADHVDDLRDSQDFLLTKGEATVNKIRELADEYQRAADASKDIEPAEGGGEIMKIAGIDTKAVKQAAAAAKKAQKQMDTFTKSMGKMGADFTKQAAATREPLKESEKLNNQLLKMASDFGEASQKAYELGPAAVAAFDQVKGGMIAAMSEMSEAVPKARRAEQMAAVGAGMDAATDVMSTGGLGLLGGAGPVGAGAASMIGMGQQGEAAYQEKVEAGAEVIAEDRAAELQKRADKMKQAGASEAALEAAGVGKEQIADAAEVTEADKKQAATGIDRGKVMAEQVKAVVQGVIDGISALLEGLPDILSTLIPLILVDLPMALIEAIPALIEELIPVLIFDLPKGIITMLIKVVPKILKMLFLDLPAAMIRGLLAFWGKVVGFFKDLFSFGKSKQTGGYVPQTSRMLLHQGERVIPASGAGSGTASRGLSAFGVGGGKSLTVNAHVVHPDSIKTLSTLIDDEMGAHGRATVPLWGSSSIPRSI
jgi:hypothetical protein